MEAMIVGFQAIFGDPFSIALLFFGVFMGIVFGCIPGLTAVLGVTLMIPFTYGDPDQYPWHPVFYLYLL